MLKIKRVYDTPSPEDGFRILIDRLWPRGLTKEKAKVDLWLKEIAPSNEPRQQFHHDETRWAELREEYFTELRGKQELVDTLIDSAKTGDVTLLFGAKNEKVNNAVTLKEYLEARRYS